MSLLFIICAVILFDQYSKYYINLIMTPGMSYPVIDQVFHITYILNPGAASGILQYQRWFFVVVAIAILGTVLYFYPRIPLQYRSLHYGLGLVVGGAVGNLIDRLQTGYVIDFFDFRIWPIFNIADVAIVGGVGLMVYALIFQINEDEPNV